MLFSTRGRKVKVMVADEHEKLYVISAPEDNSLHVSLI